MPAPCFAMGFSKTRSSGRWTLPSGPRTRRRVRAPSTFRASSNVPNVVRCERPARNARIADFRQRRPASHHIQGRRTRTSRPRHTHRREHVRPARAHALPGNAHVHRYRARLQARLGGSQISRKVRQLAASANHHPATTVGGSPLMGPSPQYRVGEGQRGGCISKRDRERGRLLTIRAVSEGNDAASQHGKTCR